MESATRAMPTLSTFLLQSGGLTSQLALAGIEGRPTHVQRRTITATLVLLLAAAHALYGQSPELAGIAHVAFRVADLEKSRQFYEQLGFEKAFEFDDAGKVTQQFIKVNNHQFIELYPRTQESQLLGLMHVCFEVADIGSLRGAYIKQRLAPTETRKFRAGNLLFVLHDPEGQLMEYTQYLPGSLHASDRGKHLGENRVSEHLQAAAIPIKDLALERTFYVNKLGFSDRGSTGTELRLPGNSGEEIELRLAAPSAKSQIVFSVSDVKITAEALRRSGLAPYVEQGEVRVRDPDRTLVVFRSRRNDQKP